MTKADPIQLQQDAWNHAGRGDLPAAMAALEQAIGLFFEHDGPQSLDAANLLAELAELQEQTNQYERANQAAQRALAILHQYEERWTDETLVTIECRCHGVLSKSLRAVGQFAGAHRAILEALRLAETHLGAEHPLTAAALIGLGVFHKYNGEFDRAEAAYQRAMEILVPLHGPDGAELAALYHNLGGLHHARGSFAAGIPWARRAWEINIREHGADSLAATADAVALAGLLDEIAPSDESEQIYRNALSVWRKAYGPEHYEVATTLHNLAALRRDRGDAAEAVNLFRQAYEMKLRLLGSGSPDTALSAMCLAQLVDRDEALELSRQALAAYEANCAPDHPELIACKADRNRLTLPPLAHETLDGGSVVCGI